MNTSKNNNIGIIIGIVGFIFFIIAITLIFSPGSKKLSNPSNTANAETEDHHENMVVPNTDNAKYNDLVGKPAPAFSVADRDGNVYNNKSLLDKNVVLFFNEGLMCYPACWNQIVALAQDKRFQDSNTKAISIVVDSKNDWQMAIEKMPVLAQAIVAFDTERTVSQEFGVLTLESSMHKGQFPGHSYIILNKQGIVESVLDDPIMGINNDKLFASITKK